MNGSSTESRNGYSISTYHRKSGHVINPIIIRTLLTSLGNLIVSMCLYGVYL